MNACFRRMAMAAVALAGLRLLGAGTVDVGVMYAPFCRTAIWSDADWERDVKAIADAGYTCAHGFCEWWRVEPEEGKFDFSGPDRFVGLCAKNGLRPILNVCTGNGVGYYMPGWMQREYRGLGVVGKDGPKKVDSQFRRACMDDPWYQERAHRYLAKVAAHYAGDDRIAAWVIWGEPGRGQCWCEHTLGRFRAWLGKRYGTVEKLNAKWGAEGPSVFRSFDEVRPPVGNVAQQGGYDSWYDWCHFSQHDFADYITNVDRIFKANGATQPTIDEFFCSVWADNVWAFARTADIVGVSKYDPIGPATEHAMTVAASVAENLGKEVRVVEDLGGPRSYNKWSQRTPTPREMRADALQCAGLGAKSVMYWTWRPRFTDNEAGNFGLCLADGTPMPRAFEGGRLARELKALGARLAAAERRSEVAVFYPSDCYNREGDSVHAEFFDARVGVLKALFDLHVTPRLLDETIVAKDVPAGIHVLVLPFAYAMDEATAAGVRRFVERGGLAFADHYLGFKRPDGHIHTRVPGGGLDEVFGLRYLEPFRLEGEVQLPKDNRYGLLVNTMLDLIRPSTAKLTEAAAPAPYAPGPVVAHNRFGKGETVYLNWYAFGSYQRTGGNVALRELLAAEFAKRGVKPFVSLGGRDGRPDPGVSVSELVRADGARILTFTNPALTPAAVQAVVPSATRAEKLVGDIDVKASSAAGDVRLDFMLLPRDAVMIEVK